MKNTMLLALGLLLCFEGSTSAQTTDDTFRLTADLSLFQYRRDRVSVDLGGDTDTQQLSFSLLSNGLGVVLGKNISESFFLGARVSVALLSISRLSDYSSIDWAIGPQAEYRFSSEGTFRPFAQLGATFSSSSESTFGDRRITRYLGFQFGIGANIFATNTFSIDPRLEVGYEAQIGTTEAETSSRSRLRFSLQVALSVWLGAESTQATTPSEAQAPTPNRVTVVPTPPRFEYARDGERVRGVRMHLQTRTTSLIFTYGPEESIDTVKLELQSTSGRPLQNCQVFMMNNVEEHLQAEIQSGNETTLSVEELRSTTQDRGTTNVRFCGRVWRVNRVSASAFTRFLQNIDVARAQWADVALSADTSTDVAAEPAVTEPVVPEASETAEGLGPIIEPEAENSAVDSQTP